MRKLRETMKQCTPRIMDGVSRWPLRDPTRRIANPTLADTHCIRTHTAILIRNGGRFVSNSKRGKVEYKWMANMSVLLGLYEI